MIRQIFACFVLCALSAGCGGQARPSTAYAKHELAGGRYFIDCEDTGGGSNLNFETSSTGTRVTKELYEFSWAGNRLLRIEDGKLAVDGEDKGALQPGDRITIRASGDVLVNGRKR